MGIIRQTIKTNMLEGEKIKRMEVEVSIL